MRFFSHLLLAALVSLVLAFAACRSTPSSHHIPKYDRIDLAWKQEREMTRDPRTGTVPRERLLEAVDWRDRMWSHRAAISGIEWRELGPTDVAGRSRTLLVDANDVSGNTIFAASVGGGLWKTTDITATTPNWTPVNDLLDNLAITSLAQAPASPQVMYFCTGEGFGNIDAIEGLGVWKSTDGGTTWGQLAATNNTNFAYCQKIVVTTPGTVLVATYAGVFRSTDGGANFTKVLGTGLGITGAASNFAYDLEVAADGSLFASLSGSLHKSTDDGATWGAAASLPVAAARIDLACAPGDANYAYALCESGGAVNGIIRTTDGGATWTARTEPTDADPGMAAGDFGNGQAWYNLAIAVDPNDREVLMVGGIDLFKSTDGGTNWTQVSIWYNGTGLQYVHADQHAIVYQPGSSAVAYFCNDGGVYRTANAHAANPTVTFKGDGFNVTQFYSCALHPSALSSYALAGAQDNGSQLFDGSGKPESTFEVTPGDGAFCHIDQDEPQYQFTAYVFNNYFRSTDGGFTWSNISIDPANGKFINPSDYDDTRDKMYMAYDANRFLRWSNPQTGSTVSVFGLSGFLSGAQISAVKVSPNNDRVFLGSDQGHLIRINNASGSLTATNLSTGLPTAYVSSIAVETGTDNHLLVTFSNYGVNSVWESTDGGSTWASVEGNLPDMPVRWAIFNPNNSDQAVLATELGVWSTDNLDGGSTVWGASNSGLANVRVDMLKLRTADKYMIAATHGRGLFGSDAFTNPTAHLQSHAKLVSYPGKTVAFTDLSYKATSWAWTFGDGNSSSSQHPTHSYAVSGVYDVALSINAGASSDTEPGLVHILPYKASPFATGDGGDFETNATDFASQTMSGTGWERGTSAVTGKDGTASGANAWVTGLSGAYTNNSEAYLYSPMYSFATAGTYTLSFSTKFDVEMDYDGFRVEYSTDQGDTWLPLGTAVEANWYNNANTTASTFPLGEAMFSGTEATFATKSKDVSFLAGQAAVTFRFVFKADGISNGIGVALDDFSISGPVSLPLPVEMLEFSGEWFMGKPNLHWTAATETEVLRYEVERSSNGTDFVQVGALAALGQGTAYTWQDSADMPGSGSHVYYRLRVVDADAHWSLSKIVALALPQRISVKVWPNPSAEAFTLRATFPISEVELFDMSGRSIRRWQQPSGDLTFGKHLPQGTYIIKVHGEEAGVQQKLRKE